MSLSDRKAVMLTHRQGSICFTRKLSIVIYCWCWHFISIFVLCVFYSFDWPSIFCYPFFLFFILSSSFLLSQSLPLFLLFLLSFFLNFSAFFLHFLFFFFFNRRLSHTVLFVGTFLVMQGQGKTQWIFFFRLFIHVSSFTFVEGRPVARR